MFVSEEDRAKDLAELEAVKGEATAYLANLTSTQERCNELLEETRAARQETKQERARVGHLHTDVLRLQATVLDYAAKLDESRREAEDLGRRLKKAQDLIDRAATFAQRVANRTDNPPKWTEQARWFADELHEARS